MAETISQWNTIRSRSRARDDVPMASRINVKELRLNANDPQAHRTQRAENGTSQIITMVGISASISRHRELFRMVPCSIIPAKSHRLVRELPLVLAIRHE